MTDLSLKSFTAIDRVADVQTYIDALSAFDAIAELQELKQLAARRVAADMRILDVGCGFGLETLRLARLTGPGGAVSGIDKSAGFIAEARRRAQQAGLSIGFEVGDADALPYPDRSFDHARAERLLIYLSEPSRAVAEMRRVVRPGGSLALIEPDIGTTTVNLADRALVRRVMAHEADTAVAQSWLPGPLAGMLTDLGLRDVSVATRVLIFPPDLAAAYFASAGTSAHHDGAISDGDLAGWMEGIGELHRKARLFATIGYFLFTAAVR